MALAGMITWQLFFLLLLGIAFIFLAPFFYQLGHRIAATRCPQCGRLFSGQPTGSTVLGVFKKYSATIGGPEPGDEDFGPSDLTPHLIGAQRVKLRVNMQCKRCGHEWQTVRVDRV